MFPRHAKANVSLTKLLVGLSNSGTIVNRMVWTDRNDRNAAGKQHIWEAQTAR